MKDGKMTIIRTRYRNHPGSNVGAIRATAWGRQATVRVDQSLSGEAVHRVAARTLANRLGLALSARPGEATDTGYTFATVAPWAPDEAMAHRAMSQRQFTDHGHAGYWDRLTRENCSACALDGYGDKRAYLENLAGGYVSHLQPNCAAWARDYIAAGRPIPAKYLDAFAVETNGGDDTPNYAYADALRRDILTFGGYPTDKLA